MLRSIGKQSGESVKKKRKVVRWEAFVPYGMLAVCRAKSAMLWCSWRCGCCGGFALGPREGHRHLQIVARPPNLTVLLRHCGQLLLRKISKFDATRCHRLKG